MHYDRPVRELLADCVRALRTPFTRQDVLTWFGQHYPLVKATTISTHLAGLTEGPRPHAYLAQYPALVRRVDHGLYEPTGHAASRGAAPTAGSRPRAPSSAVRPGSSARGEMLLLGCVKSKRSEPAPACDLYTSELFTRRRRYAEAAGLPWYVLSARYGLVRPEEILAPYDVHLAGQSASYRAAWGAFVVEQLRRERGDLSGLVIEVHAGDAYVEAVRDPLERAGSVVLDPVDARSMGETLAWYDARSMGETLAWYDARSAGAGSDVEQLQPAVGPPEADRGSETVRFLGDPDQALRVPELLRSERRALEQAGLYSWWVDEPGARDLSSGLRLPVAAGLIYAGQAGATRWPSGRPSSNNLWSRLTRMHARGRAEFSTFRRTLAAALREPLALTSEDDPRLDDWIDAHLRVVALPVDDPGTLSELEDDVLEELDPPLNLQGMAPSPVRARLSQLRRERA